MIITYTFAWTPYAVISLWVMYISDVPVWVHVLPTMMAKSSCLVNPIVYCVLSENFRNAVKTLITKKKTTIHPGQKNSIEMEDLAPGSSGSSNKAQSDK